jgi:hypothetical protein
LQENSLPGNFFGVFFLAVSVTCAPKSLRDGTGIFLKPNRDFPAPIREGGGARRRIGEAYITVHPTPALEAGSAVVMGR